MPRRDDTFRWLALLIVAFATVAFLLYARGVSHRHGQQVGAAGTGVVVAAALVTAPAPGPGTAGDRA